MDVVSPHPRHDRPLGGRAPAGYSLFQEPWWLDALAPGQWREAMVEASGGVAARLPYVVRRRAGMTILTQPPLTQTLGPWLAPLDGKYVTRLGDEKRLLQALIRQLPDFDVFEQQFSPLVTNVLPFLWAGFDASVRYTYRLENLVDLDRVWHDFDERVRWAVRKAEEQLRVEDDVPFETFLELHRSTFARRRLPPPCSDDALRRLDEACAARGARRLFGAFDAQDRIHAVLYLVWDGRAAYALSNARDERLAHLGAVTQLYWEAIRFAAGVTEVFDFEGSIIEPIEHFVRSFGGKQTPYFRVTMSSARARALRASRSALRGLLRRTAAQHA